MISNLKQITPVQWEIAKETMHGMRVNARLYSTAAMLELIASDRSIRQLMNVATLPGIKGHALVMPDVHEGYGFPIGGVAAIDYKDGVISPGGIGYDINCGVRLLKTEIDQKEIRSRLDELAKELNKYVPSGVGKGGGLKLNMKELEEVLNNGVKWALEQGFGEDKDPHYIESRGSLPGAEASAVSDRAKERGRSQLGTMGAGNHFVEVDRIQNILDEEAAAAFGLYPGQIVIQIHTGSRGLGHQVAADYIRQIIGASKSFGYDLPDRELSCAPLNSPLGQDYFAAMCASANYAWTNRQLITHEVREAWENIFGKSAGRPRILYDVAHNIAKIEEHTIDGEKSKVIVHRKGATRAFPAHHPETPERYGAVGQPVLIPGSMGTSSYVLAGLPGSMEHSFGTSCHGAGRTMSRSKARKSVRGEDLLTKLKEMGISIQAGSYKGLSEESPDAYKDVESVVDIVEEAGIAKKVARLKPMAVVKG